MLRKTRRTAGTSSRRRLRIETLESRQLLTAMINEVLTSNGDDLTTRVRVSTESPFVSLPITPDWIELSNSSGTAIDLSGFHLTDNKGRPTRWEFPVGTTIPRDGYLVVFASGENTDDPALDETGRLHTSFQLSSGDYLALTDAEGSVVDEIDIPKMRRDVSYGFDANQMGGYYLGTTPGAANTTDQFSFVADTSFSHDRGLYSAPFDVTISTKTEGATIVYTLDGSLPTVDANNVVTNGSVYTQPISVTTTTNLRAMAFKAGLGATNVDTQTYVFPADVLQQRDDDIPEAANWGSSGPDWEMDPDVVNLPDGDPNKPTVDDLASIPTVSITMNWDDLFGPDGIYLKGEHVEKAMSFEFFDPATGESTQQNASIEVQGGSSVSVPRNWKTDKISMLVRFKDPYGPTRLDANIFGEGSTTQFDQMTIDGQLNFVWDYGPNNTQRSQALYIHDQVAADVQNAISGDGAAPHGRFVHLYRNGVYWGMHYLHERPDESFAAEYYGGDKEEYHALNQNRTISQAINPDGSPTPANGATDDLDDAVALARAAGRGGIDEWNAVNEHIDVEHFIDYLLMNWYLGNEDWGADNKNWYASRKNTPDGRWRFHSWDAEKVFQDFARGGVDEVGGGPKGLHKDLLGNEEYEILFADRIRELLFNGGVLTTEGLTPIFQARVDEVESALRTESARWGDNRVSSPYVRQDVMDNFQSVYDNFFPPRHDRVLEDLIEEGVYPEVSAPDLRINDQNQHGGVIDVGDSLSMLASAATITTDTVLIPRGATVKAFVPTDGSLESGALTWKDPDFDDSGWTLGEGNVGFGDDFPNRIDVDIVADFTAHPTSVYTRYDFELPDLFNASDLERLNMEIKIDDGFVAYLNGTEVARADVPEDVQFDSRATTNGSNFIHKLVDRYIDVDLSNHTDALRPGGNVLAIHALVADNDDDNLVVGVALEMSDDETLPAPVVYTLDGTDPREVGGANVGVTYAAPISLDGSTEVKARAFVAGQWSALTSASFTVPTDPGRVLISEINYNPHQPTDDEARLMPDVGNDDFEFIEVFNPSATEPVSLLGLQLANGVEFTFPNFDLAPQGHAVVVEDVDAFALRYGTEIDVIGQWSGGLSNSGEAIELVDGGGVRLVEIGYSDSDPWFERTDGIGATIELDSLSANVAEIGKYYHWRASSNVGGTPGAAPTQTPQVVISEVLASSNQLVDEQDAIELFNRGATPVDIGGWFLSDSSRDLFKYEIPAGTTLDPQSYVVFSESDFNPSDGSGFALSSSGDDVWLVSRTSVGGIDQFIDDVHFGATANSESIGSVPDSTGFFDASERFGPLRTSSLGSANGPPRVGPVIFSEVNYNPGEPNGAAQAAFAEIRSSDLEFVEIYNPTASGLDLTDWRIRGGVDIDFDDQTMLASGGTLLVLSFDPVKPENADRLAAFRAQYGLSADVLLVGGYSGQLNNGGDRVQLQRPGSPSIDDPDVPPRLYEDEVLYDDLAPWPTAADGTGTSLHRIAATAYGNYAVSWQSAVATPGVVDFGARPGDLNHDGSVDGDDIDLVCGTVNGPFIPDYDFNNDGTNNLEDVVAFVEGTVGTFMGDADVDHTVGAIDLNRVGVNWTETGPQLGWVEGDFNCDDRVNAADLTLIGLNWQKRGAVNQLTGTAPSAVAASASLPTTAVSRAIELAPSESGISNVRSIDRAITVDASDATGKDTDRDVARQIARLVDRRDREGRLRRRSQEADDFNVRVDTAEAALVDALFARWVQTS